MGGTEEKYIEHPDLVYSRKMVRNGNTNMFQWEYDPIFSEKGLVTLSVATKASTNLIMVPAGYEFHFRSVFVSSVGTKKSLWKIKFGYTTQTAPSVAMLIPITTLTGPTDQSRLGVMGFVARGRISVSKTTAATGIVTIGGVLIPIDPGW